MNLKDKTVLVTGGTLRIGRAIAQGFARKGAHVLIHYNRSHEEAFRFVDGLGGDARAYQADFKDIGQVQRMVESILKDAGSVDVLVNNASVFFPTPLETVTEAEWDEVMAVNLKAPYFLSKALAPPMKKRGQGRIINIADYLTMRPPKNYSAYVISKAGLVSMTQSLAKALAPEIAVTAVCPGLILPPKDMTEEEKNRAARQPLVGRWGEMEDVVKMVVFLAESDFMTGSCHLVEGGEFLRGSHV